MKQSKKKRQKKQQFFLSKKPSKTQRGWRLKKEKK